MSSPAPVDRICRRLDKHDVEDIGVYSRRAVRAVLDLHQAQPVAVTPLAACGHCGYVYPCPTVSAIAAALGVSGDGTGAGDRR